MGSKRKKYNARFPPARIKKIMQKDEEVGKVAAAVPVIISRALELFVESLLVKASDITRSRAARTLTTSHLKASILSDPRLGFLSETLQSVPDVNPDEDCGETGSGNPMPLMASSIAPPGAQRRTSGIRRRSRGGAVVGGRCDRRESSSNDDEDTDSAPEDDDDDEDDDAGSESTQDSFPRRHNGASVIATTTRTTTAPQSEQLATTAATTTPTTTTTPPQAVVEGTRNGSGVQNGNEAMSRPSVITSIPTAVIRSTGQAPTLNPASPGALRIAEDDDYDA